PQSCSDSTSTPSTSSSEPSISCLPVNGSPICTEGRFSSEPSPSSWLASTEAPPIPSRPVVAPNSTTTLPVPCALALVTRSAGRSPTHIALTKGLCSYASSKTASPPTVGTPT